MEFVLHISNWYNFTLKTQSKCTQLKSIFSLSPTNISLRRYLTGQRGEGGPPHLVRL